jgi:hypothetical protein
LASAGVQAQSLHAGTSTAVRLAGWDRCDTDLKSDGAGDRPNPELPDNLHLAQLRRQAKQLGLKLPRSRWHQPYVRNRGGLILLDNRDEVVAGDGYSLNLVTVERILSVIADQTPSSMSKSMKRMTRG